LHSIICIPHNVWLLLRQAGELFDFLNVRGRLHEGAARRFFQQLITGIEACHAAGALLLCVARLPPGWAVKLEHGRKPVSTFLMLCHH
jgi:serine/threonine protein kinase